MGTTEPQYLATVSRAQRVMSEDLGVPVPGTVDRRALVRRGLLLNYATIPAARATSASSAL